MTTAASNPFTELDVLVSLITSSVDTIKSEYTQLNTSAALDLSLDSTEKHPLDLKAVPQTLQDALRTLQGSCAQLGNIVLPPAYTIATMSMSHFTAACLNVAVTTKVADHLLPSGAQGLHVKDLSKLTGIVPNKLSRVLRLLATKGCFKEVEPDVWANNRLSVTLLKDEPTSALVGLFTDEAYLSGTSLASTLTDPHYGPSLNLNEASWNRAMNFKGTLWDFYKDVDPARGKRLAEAQVGFSHVLTFESVLHGFPWSTLPDGTTICDLGGGFGHVSMHIAKACPQLRVVLQDQPSTVATAREYWNKSAAEVVEQGRVEFVDIDFIKEAPREGCDYYFIKNVVHDWPDHDVITILCNVKKSMKPTAKVLIHEFVMQHASSDPHSEDAFLNKAPKPLLPSYGEGRVLQYYLDVGMMGVVNAKERTFSEFKAIGKEVGLELEKVWESGQASTIEFKLAEGSTSK
ncbi:unnamed protein product [Somion occarium]|uniref:S-adenosyl-L-methionine-dependent methyltransferase n=1 Tax=Somion occarium TaxID=3059160 RepID=A0ABP1E1J0_9APHY